MDSVAIVVPTLVRADRLEACLASIQAHAGAADVRVYNNWTHKGVAQVCAFFACSTGPTRFAILPHPDNLGCAGSWNAGLKAHWDRGHEWAVVMNDDVELLPGTVDALRAAIESGLDLAWSSESMACFAIHRRATDAIGWFDENLWPAYHEDEDFTHRMRLAGLRCGDAKAEVKHTRTSTLNYSDLLWFQHRMRLDHQNLLYYGRKWGGVPNFEKFTRPFNDLKVGLDFFPEPKKKSMGVKLDAKDRVVLDQSRPFSVRLYGSFLTNGSFGRVSQGLRQGLTELGLLAGSVELDAFDADEIAEAPGREATIGLYAGNPSFISVMASQGAHDMNFAILAPNSSWLPEVLVQSMRERAAIVSPSSWGADVLREYGAERFPPIRHGIAPSFRVLPGSENLGKTYQDGHFQALHLSSTHRQRKGTAELFQAWMNLAGAGKLGKSPLLVAVVDAPEGSYPEAEKSPFIAFSSRRLEGSDDSMPAIYQSFHLIVQPSRGEGFGMVPIEARACGIPVVATACTGHSEHMVPEPPGCVTVATGPLTPIDDGPGAMAPELTVKAIEDALEHAYNTWPELFRASRANAEATAKHWSWSNQTRTWLKEMGLYKGEEQWISSSSLESTSSSS